MFTTHKSKPEFYDWWKQQDHKAHTCKDMVVFTLMKAYWVELKVWGPLAGTGIEGFMAQQLLRAFRKHNKDGYRAPILALEHLKYCLKWPKFRYGFNTFKDCIAGLDGESLALATNRLENVIGQIRDYEAANVSA